MKSFKFSCILILLCLYMSNAQSDKFSFSVAYPIPLGQEVFKKNDGIIDVGVQYRFNDIGPVVLGASANVGFYTYEQVDIGFTNRDVLVQPRIFAELPISKFRPFVGLGYTFTRLNEEFDFGTNEINKKWSGINLNIGASFDILAGLFVRAEYDFIRFFGSDVFDSKDYNPVSTAKIGLGYRF